MLTQTTGQDTQGAVSNTALDSQKAWLPGMSGKVDWISLSFQVAGSKRLDKLIESIQDRYGVEFYFDAPKIKDTYAGRYTIYSGSLGCSFSHTSFSDNDICNARLTLPGQLLNDRRTWHTKSFCRYLAHEFKAVCTRIDIAVDDYQKQLDYDKIINASKSKDVVGVRTGKTIESWGSKTAGRTVYCGARTSAKFARFYNKGEFDRFEIEYKQSLADSIFRDYNSDISPSSSFLLSSVLRSSISFVVKRDKNLSRSVVCDWWSSFQDRILGTKHDFPPAKPRPSLDRTLSWIHRSVSKSLLLMREALGELWMEKLLQLWEWEARSRITSKDLDMLNQFKQHGFSLSDLMNMI